jgi:hypothetical protein
MKKMKLCVYLFASAFIFACRSHDTNKQHEQIVTEDTQSSASGKDSMNVTVKTFSENDEWGYDILINDKMYIHQPHIPAVSGNNGFATEAVAKKTGEFVAFKIRNHIMPPSVTPHELDSLQITSR